MVRCKIFFCLGVHFCFFPDYKRSYGPVRALPMIRPVYILLQLVKMTRPIVAGRYLGLTKHMNIPCREQLRL
ncbi:hypothetical protein HanHA300_Chr09g0338041 [Helianthus annuus]|nr:hypothetical protein HanHA300_Chr09g0338041 [Helianthus annuus]